jgi:SPX domain protein involved in polyphosphate accumulation
MDNHTLVGPFVREDEAVYFHLMCLEINTFVRYDKKQQKWENVALAVKHLVEQRQFSCYRCLLPGSTI